MDERRRPARERGQRARRSFLLLLGALLGLGAPRAATAAAVEVGDLAPRLVLRTADGRQFNLQEECGKRPVLLAFESPRCKPCRESRPALDKLCQDYGSGNKVALLSVMLGSEAASQTGGGTLPHAPHCSETLAAGSDATAEEFGVFGTPVFFLIGRQGTVLWKHVGRLALGAVDQALDTGLAALNPSAR